jgi:hypothetical protein
MTVRHWLAGVAIAVIVPACAATPSPDRTAIADTAAPTMVPATPDSGLLMKGHPDIVIAKWFNRSPWPNGPNAPHTATTLDFNDDGSAYRVKVYMPESQETNRDVMRRNATVAEGYWAATGTRDTGELCTVFPRETKRCEHYRMHRVYDTAVESPTLRRVLILSGKTWKEDKGSH